MDLNSKSVEEKIRQYRVFKSCSQSTLIGLCEVANPPMVVGVGIGGTFEKCAILAKKALTRPVNEHSNIPYVKDLENEMLEKINKLGIGPGGLGGTTTALAVNINTYPTHIAGLPVAVNICCHVNRHVVREV